MKNSLSLSRKLIAKMINIVLVDDHQILLDGLEALLEMDEQLKILAKYVNGDAILDSTHLDHIDIIIMDINMQDKDGIMVFQELKDKGFKGKCIFLSSYDDLKLINEAIRIGAKGYVTKSSATDHLEMAIKEVMNGGIYYSPDVKSRIINAFSNPGSQSDSEQTENGILRQLTERELEVLKLIAMQFTSEEIAKKLYIARSTVDTHRKNLIYKLKVKNAVGLGLFAERHGLI